VAEDRGRTTIAPQKEIPQAVRHSRGDLGDHPKAAIDDHLKTGQRE
jgi:hypothetical protein